MNKEKIWKKIESSLAIISKTLLVIASCMVINLIILIINIEVSPETEETVEKLLSSTE
tara:strand:+ start:70 stop:243 length:174 start_codon:yes stop_codon:yes gene_type:complete